MRLTPTERDRLLVFTAAQVARRRHERGLRLNVPEATALVADTVIEAARDGLRMPQVVAAGRAVLGPDDVLPGVAAVVPAVTVEAVFDDGTRLVVVTDPFRGAEEAIAGPAEELPGAIVPAPVVDARRSDRIELVVRNTASVPVTVTSHWHFFEANAALRFDRAAAYGRHLDVPAGTGVRFGPGEPVTVGLIPMGGRRVAVGFAGLVDGPLDEPGMRERALERAIALGYQHSGDGEAP